MKLYDYMKKLMETFDDNSYAVTDDVEHARYLLIKHLLDKVDSGELEK